MGSIQLLSFTGFLKDYYNQTSLKDNYYQPFSLPEKEEPLVGLPLGLNQKVSIVKPVPVITVPLSSSPAIEDPCLPAASMLAILCKQDCPAVWGDPVFITPSMLPRETHFRLKEDRLFIFKKGETKPL